MTAKEAMIIAFVFGFFIGGVFEWFVLVLLDKRKNKDGDGNA